MNEKTKAEHSTAVTRRSVHLPDEVYSNVCTLARQKHTTPAEIMRSLISKGLTVSFIEDSEGMVRRIVHDEVKNVLEHEIDRLVKLILKCTKAASTSLFLLLLLIINDYTGEMTAADLLANAFKESAKFMRMKDKSHEEYLAEAKDLIGGAKTIGRKDDN